MATSPPWRLRIRVHLNQKLGPDADGQAVAALFGLPPLAVGRLYDDLPLEIAPGQIVAVVGPSGAGKSVLLREACRQVPGAVGLDLGALAGEDAPPVAMLVGGDLGQRLEVLSRCGLAEASALVTPSRLLSGGQQYRLALAMALHRARRKGEGQLVVADEFASSLDAVTAEVLCRQVRKLVAGSGLGLLLATPRSELLGALAPDRVIVKPLGERARVEGGTPARRPPRWRLRRGSIRDYDGLGQFHYLAGPPAAHKRVYVAPAPRGARACGGPELAGVLVVSPPLLHVRGRNLATGGRYVGQDRSAAHELLNAEMECISRVVVHPTYRGCGLAVRLVRHALARARTPMMEALAAMGTVHPFFERAGMRAWHVPPDVPAARLLSAAEAVGLTPGDLLATDPVRAVLRRSSSCSARLLRRELDRYVAARVGPQRRPGDAVLFACRSVCRQYVYYLADRPGR